MLRSNLNVFYNLLYIFYITTETLLKYIALYCLYIYIVLWNIMKSHIEINSVVNAVSC